MDNKELFEMLNQRFDKIDKRFEKMDERMDKMEVKYCDQWDKITADSIT